MRQSIECEETGYGLLKAGAGNAPTALGLLLVIGGGEAASAIGAMAS
ncbi:MAG: hypothetical protein ABSF67_01580 [Roseiarcus sp.]|jgi:hypothetical protein